MSMDRFGGTYLIFRRADGGLGAIYDRSRPLAEGRLRERAPGALVGGELDDFALVAQALGLTDTDPAGYHDAHIVEATCTVCDRTFNPNPFEDEGPWLEHLGDEYGNECGGVGRPIGAIYLPGVPLGREAVTRVAALVRPFAGPTPTVMAVSLGAPLPRHVGCGDLVEEHEDVPVCKTCGRVRKEEVEVS
jgi:hypothetical protein